MFRVFRFPPLTPFTKLMLISIFGVFVTTLLVERLFDFPAVTLLALDPEPSFASLWQVFTHVLAYPASSQSVVSLLISLVFLWWIAAPFEAQFGVTATLQATVAGTFAAGVGAILGGVIGLPPLPVFGLGPIILVLLAAYAISLPKAGQLSFFGVLPLKRDHLIWLLVGVSALMAVADSNYVGLLSDLAAIGAGVGYMKWFRRPRTPVARKPKKKRNGAKRAHGLHVIEGGGQNPDDDNDDDRPKWLN